MAVSIFQNDLRDAIEQCKVLVVGAGGIGCEILKNLVLSGFKNIDIIDLDTIDISNLNRQFLFHKEHVGKSKAEVAKSSALKFNPNVSISAKHDSIMNDDYNVGYFKSFTLVLNALDNRAARNHVNRMCLAADIPLLDSGTAGYAGQVELIKKGLTQCYECQPKARQKTIPGCTIRNTPSEPAHCVMWAKHLFNQLFGEEDADQDVSPDTADPELGETQSTESGDVVRRSTRGWAKDSDYDPKLIFNKLFHEDIEYLLTLTPLWKARRAPKPLHWDSAFDVTVLAPSYTSNQRVWTIAECTKVFSESIQALKQLLASRPDGDHLIWDKDDRNSMDFVTACTNIRAHIFGISEKSQFEIKSIAGNIIPAIATANAVVAGLAVMRAIGILRGNIDGATSVYLRPQVNHRGQLFVPEKILSPPNPKCYVCAAKPEVTLACNLSTLTIQGLSTALTEGLSMRAPDATVEGRSTVVLSSEPGESALDKTLQEMGLVDGSSLIADDFLQNYEVRVCLKNDSEEKVWKIITDGTEPMPTPQPNKTENATNHRNGSPAPGPSAANNKDSDSEPEIIGEDLPAKRKHEDDDDDEANTSKRARTESDNDDIMEIN